MGEQGKASSSSDTQLFQLLGNLLEQNSNNNNNTSLLAVPEGYTKPLKAQGVRWRNFFRSIAKGTGNRYNAKCGFCLFDIVGRPERLHNHALCCTRWPVVEKTAYLQDAAKEKAGSVQQKEQRGEAVISGNAQHKRTRGEVVVSGSFQNKRPKKDTVVSLPSAKQLTLLSSPKPVSSHQPTDIDDLLLKAIIYGGISFTVGDNLFFKQFVHTLSPSYSVPSSETLRGRLLTELFSKHLQNKLAYLPSFADFTICFDGWTDVSDNSICAFMIVKEECEHVLDIVDLSEVCHSTLELEERLLSNLLIKGVVVANALACVTNTPAAMVKLQNELRAAYPNVIPVRCCLHAFNLLAKDVLGFHEVVKACELNQKLVNYFISSHVWRKTLKKWQEEKKLPHALSTFCETRWYSLSRVCLGVAAYEDGFLHCLELSKMPGYPKITNLEVLNTITNRHHFAVNDCLVEALKPIVDVIGNLEKRSATLADVLGSFIIVYHNAKTAHYAITGLKRHILCAIGKRVKDFEDPIYFIALFLHPAYKNVAMSRMMTGEKIIRAALEIAKLWHFSKREVGLLFKELINYKNGDAPFDDLKETSSKPARDIWESFCGGSPLLRRFATKVFSIVPHSGPCEHVFSRLGLSKTKPRNFEAKVLNMLAQIKCDSTSEVCSTKRICEESCAMVDGLSFGDSDTSVEVDVMHDLLDEEVEVVRFDNDLDAERIFENFFDLDVFERDNSYVPPETSVDCNEAASRQDDEDWSIDDVIHEFS